MLETKLQQAVTLHTQGQLSRAQSIYEEILRAQPRHFDALHLMGVIAAMSGNPRKAAELIGRALEVVPESAIAHNNRGAALHELGQWEAALASYERAAALKRDYAEPLYNRGNLFKDLKRWQAAVTSYEQAIALRQDYAEAWCNRGICLAEMAQWQAALASYDRAITINPGYAEAHYNRATVLCGLRDWEAALNAYDRALVLKRDYAEAHSNRAFALKELGRLDEALASCDRAAALKPGFAAAYSNRGGVLVASNRIAEALASYDKAISLEPHGAAAYVNRGMARLLLGDYPNGWADYEWRWKDTAGWIIKEKRDFPQPLWLGETSLAGRSILLQSEQGYGDTIQFCRYAKEVAALGARVILEVPQALAGVLRSLAGVAQLVVQGESLPPFDCYCPLLSLPLAMRTTLAAVPAPVPYLRASDEQRRRWRGRLGERRGPRVGLVWSGGFRPGLPALWSGNDRRNIPLTALSALKDSGADFYSLQKGQPAESELAALLARNWDGPPIRDYTRELDDFDATAALIEQLDLVISVDTATAHLAGALGKPVWILNRFDTCWRWLLERSDSPWYPTATLYRQERAGDWAGVIRRVHGDLLTFCR